MAATSSPTKPDKASKGDALPAHPPEEQFWQKYSPHYEFPLSNVVSVALHVLVILGIIFLIDGPMQPDVLPSPQVHGRKIAAGSAGGQIGGAGTKGSESKVEAAETEASQETQRVIPDAELKTEVDKAATWLPDMKNNQDAMKKIIQSPGYEKLDKLNDDLKKRVAKGFGSGAKDGESGKGGGGTADKGAGDSSTTGSRSLRWNIIFNTTSGQDYLKQLNSFKAKIVIPEPPDWKSNLLFEDIVGKKEGKKLAGQDLPEMSFTDSDKSSVSKVAHALGLNYDPPYFLAFFPAEIEAQLAAKEQAYRGRREDQIFSTTFRVIERNGEYIITVTDQVAQGKGKK